MWIITVVRICGLRAGPQDLPTSTALTVLALMLYALTDFVVASQTAPLVNAIEATVVDTLLLAALTQWALNRRQMGERARQTLTALAGCGALLAITTLLLEYVLSNRLEPAYLWLPTLIWTFIVYGHVLRHALNIPFAAGVLTASVYVIGSLMLTGLFLFPSTSH